MECHMCRNTFRARERPPICASCVHATLYKPRLEQAVSLLDREKAHTHVEAVIRPGNDGILAALPEDADWDAVGAGVKSNNLERLKAEKEAVGQRIGDIASKADQLRQQVEDYKAFAAKQEEENSRRHKDLATERAQLEKNKTRVSEPVHAASRKARHRLEKVHKRTVEAREHLCREVSSLSGLSKRKSHSSKTEYTIGSVPLLDLKDLNAISGKVKVESIEITAGSKALAEPHELISASLDNVCRLLGIGCHYLSVRLPAEIILPRNDFPHAAILPRDSSYKADNILYPGFDNSRSSSPSASRVLKRTDLPRPRILQLDRPLPQLQKEDPKAAMLFIEGVTLLAYDIAWLCRSQGVGTFNSFEEIFGIGKNLYQLLSLKDGKIQGRPALTRNIISATAKVDKTTEADPAPRFGTHSHGSARHSLAGHEGFNLLSHDVWQVSVTRLTDQLRSVLRNEIARAEWHVIEDIEWDEDLEHERPVLVGGSRKPDPTMSILSVKPSDGMDESEHAPRILSRNAGWMKIRDRGGES